MTLHVGYGGQDYKLLALVVKGAGPNLLGRDWLRVIKMNWKTRFKVKEDHLELSQVLELYNEVFKDELGTLKGTKAKIHVDANAKPKFCKARSVPYALKDKIEHELDRLINEGILSPTGSCACQGSEESRTCCDTDVSNYSVNPRSARSDATCE